MEGKPKQKKRWSLELDAEEDVAFDRILQKEPYRTLRVSKRAMMRMAILNLAADEKEPPEALQPATKGDIEALKLLVLLAPSMDTRKKQGRPVREVEEGKEDKEETGISICSILEGTIDGRGCKYDKYEVLASGRPVKYSVTTPLTALTDADVIAQYDPSKDAWDIAKANEN